MNELNNVKTMTVKEVANVFNVSERTVQRSIKKLFPDLVRNGFTTYLNEIQVTKIKMDIEKHHNLVSTDELPETELEMLLLDKKVSMWKDRKIAEQKEIIKEKNEIIYKQDYRISKLVHSNKTYTATELADELNITSAQKLNTMLKNDDIQYKVNGTWVLKAKYANEGLSITKQTELDNGYITYNLMWTGKGREFILNKYDKNIKGITNENNDT